MKVTNMSQFTPTRTLIALTLVLFIFLSLIALYFAGCTDTLKGNENENQKPIVYFANIPPEGQRTGRNLVVYWYGTDRDGLIDYYRYHIATVAEVGSELPQIYIQHVPDSEWNYVDVEPREADPKTAQVIPLEADMNDPVNSFVPQWVFLQAFDMEGLGSDIVFRLFSRNDNPPETNILDFSTRIPFVDGDVGSVIAGVKINWSGSDRIDYPSNPPLEYEWRLYGPYPDTVFERLTREFMGKVFVSRDAKLYYIGDTVEFCDTLVEEVRCTTFVITQYTEGSRFGSMQDMFFVDDPDFVTDPELNVIVARSFDEEDGDEWVTSTSTTIYNVYKDYARKVAGTPADTTVEMQFIFWVRSRDDAFVPDIVPAYANFPVIRPRFEREVAVIDFTKKSGSVIPPPDIADRVTFWNNAIHKWKPNVSFEADVNDVDVLGIDEDYLDVNKMAGVVPLKMLLKHKVLIVYDDDFLSNLFASETKAAKNIYKAIDAGVNVWLIMRASLNTGTGEYMPNFDFTVSPSSDYWWYFGVTKLPYSGWICHAVGTKETGGCGPPYPTKPSACDRARIEDFIGAYALDSAKWPNLEIDTTLLQTRYHWGSLIPSHKPCTEYDPSLPALPEVNWAGRTVATEALYLYKSLYGSNHPLGSDYNMEGNPVAHRYNSGLFKTAHFSFTPLAIDSVQMQVVVDSILNWLYDPSTTEPTKSIRYPDAPVKISVSEERERYWRRVDEEAKEGELGALY
jgi:hypothetical protein